MKEISYSGFIICILESHKHTYSLKKKTIIGSESKNARVKNRKIQLTFLERIV